MSAKIKTLTGVEKLIDLTNVNTNKDLYHAAADEFHEQVGTFTLFSKGKEVDINDTPIDASDNFQIEFPERPGDTGTASTPSTAKIASDTMFRGNLSIREALSGNVESISVQSGWTNKELHAEVAKLFNAPIESVRLIHNDSEIPLDNELLTKTKYNLSNKIFLVIQNNLYDCAADANKITYSELKQFLIANFLPDFATTTHSVDDDENGVKITFTKSGDKWNFTLQKLDNTGADLATMAAPYISKICGHKKSKYEELTDVKTFRLWVAFKEYVQFPDSFAKDVKYLPLFLRKDAEENKATAWAVFSYTAILAYIELLISQATDTDTKERLRRVIGALENGNLWTPDQLEFYTTESTPIEAKYAAEQCKDTIYKDVVPIALANVFK